MAVLFVASEASELKPVAGRLTGLRALKWPLDYAQEGILEGRRVLLAANGAGPKLAADALEVAIRAITAAELQSSALEMVVSVGYCGALRADLREGQVVVATEVKSPESEEVLPSQLVEAEQPFVTGVILSQDRIVWKSGEKAALGQRYQVIAVEMEAFGVAARAKRAGLPFCCIKVVSDRVDESFGFDLNQIRSADGRLSRVKIVGKAVVRPGMIPELVRLKRRAEMAAGVLGDFLVGCKFSVPAHAE